MNEDSEKQRKNVEDIRHVKHVILKRINAKCSWSWWHFDGCMEVSGKDGSEVFNQSFHEHVGKREGCLRNWGEKGRSCSVSL